MQRRCGLPDRLSETMPAEKVGSDAQESAILPPKPCPERSKLKRCVPSGMTDKQCTPAHEHGLAVAAAVQPAPASRPVSRLRQATWLCSLRLRTCGRELEAANERQQITCKIPCNHT